MKKTLAHVFALLMTLALMACSTPPVDYLDQTPPEQKITINPLAKWRVAPARTGNAYTTAHHMEQTTEKLMFQVNETSSRVAWELRLGHVIDINQYPILTLKYRSNSPSRFDVWSLWANNLAYEDYKKGFYVFEAKDLVADNEIHTITKDLRELRDDGFINMLVFGYRNNASSPANLEVFELSLSPATAEQGASYPIPAYRAEMPMRVKIVDAQGQPIEGAKVTVDEALLNMARFDETDEMGVASVVPFSLGLKGKAKHTMRIEAPGYIDALVRDVNDIQVVDGEGYEEALPTVTLIKASYPSIDVIDKATNEAVADVSVHMQMVYTDDLPKLPYELMQDWFYMTKVTDTDHQKIAFPVPSDFVENVKVFLYHDLYNTPEGDGKDVYNDRSKIKFGPYATLTVDELEREVLRYEVESLPYAHGTVTDFEGKPLAGVLVSMYNGYCPWYPRTLTNVNGEYKLPRIQTADAGNRVLNFSHEKAAPAYIDLRKKSIDEIVGEANDIQLGEPSTIWGTVLDVDGNPIKDLEVTLYNWSLIEPSEKVEKHHICDTSIGVIKMIFKTDANGKFEIPCVADGVLYRLGLRKKGSEYQSLAPIVSTDKSPYTFTMTTYLTLTGTVTDKETGEPIKDFRVAKGIGWENRSKMHWQFNDRGITVDGNKFKAVYRSTYPKHAIRVEAPGYKAAETAVVKDGEANAHFDIQLEKGELIKGKVIDANGQPVVGAKVMRVNAGEQANLSHPSERMSSDQPVFMSNADGEFSFTEPEDDFALVVTHVDGWQILKLDETTEENLKQIKLLPWASVTGQLTLGGEPLVGHKVSLDMDCEYRHHDRQNQKYTGINYGWLKKTDAEGRFEFEYAPAGEGKIKCFAKQEEGDHSLHEIFSKKIELKAGANEIAFVHDGSRIVGQIKHPTLDEIPSEWVKEYSHAMLRSHLDPEATKPPLPENWEDMEQDEKMTWWKAFEKSDEHKAWRKKSEELHRNRKHYQVKLGTDGSFEVFNVEPGKYTLNVRLYKRNGNQMSEVAGVNTDIEIPEKTSKVHDVGTFTLNIIKSLNIGDMAPDFEVKDLHDLEKTFKLSDFRGKYVLIDFWATWCGPCVGETPNIKAAYEALKDENFTVIALSLDQKAETPLKYAKKKELVYPQGFLGDWGKDSVTKQYSVRGIPAIFVIDPEGKLIGKNIRGAGMTDEIRKLMKK